MRFDDYQQFTRTTALYKQRNTGFIADILSSLPPKKAEKLNRLLDLLYAALGLAGEAGEIANKIKKVLRDGGGEPSTDVIAALLDEAGDAAWYNARLVDELDGSFGDVIVDNMAKLTSRKARGVLSGSGDQR